MVKSESLRINMFRITRTGKSVNFPVTILIRRQTTLALHFFVEIGIFLIYEALDIEFEGTFWQGLDKDQSGRVWTT